MRKLSYILLGILLGGTLIFLMGCDQNRFTAEMTIEPKLTQYSGKIAVQFTIGDLLILDEWDELNAGQLLWIMDEDIKKIVNLRIEFGDFSTTTDGFYYLIGQTEIFTTPVDWKIISKHVNSLDNVVWSMKDGKSIRADEEQPEKESETAETGTNMDKL